MAGKTLIHDKSTGKTYIGKFTPSQTQTAHQQLAAAAGISTSNAVAGSIKHGSAGWSLGQRSESVNNANVGKCKAHGNSFKPAKQNLSSANYYTVSKNGSVNKGSKKYSL